MTWGLRKGRRLAGEEDVEDPEARLLDLRKAYPRVSHPVLWGILRRYGLRGNFKNTVNPWWTFMKQRSIEWEKERVSRGSQREGCPTSPVLFNIFHQAVMRLAERKRDEERENQQNPVGIRWRWLPGSNIPGEGREKYNSEAVDVRWGLSLFADDTTVIGTRQQKGHR